MEKFKNYNFTDFFDPYRSNLPYLPLCHTTDGYTARQILDSGLIATSPCPIFEGQDLLYFFYGKPAYRLNSQSTAGTGAFWPVTFLLKSNKVTPARVFPFDSGAFRTNRFNGFFHPKMDISKFQLDSNILKLKNFIKFFYQKNENYFLGKPISDLEKDIPQTFFELESYYEMLKSKNTMSSDDRDRTIEVVLDQDIVLSSKSILLAVVPTFYLDDEVFKSSLNEFAEVVYDYPTIKANPIEFQGLIFERVRTYLKRNKFL